MNKNSINRDELYEIVLKFRNAIDLAYKDNRFKKIPFDRFPYDCCCHASHLLEQHLSEMGLDIKIVNGKCRYDNSWHHVWLLINDEMVVDITCDQFNGKFKELGDNINPVYFDKPGIIQNIFCVDLDIECRQNFLDSNYYFGFDGRPSAFQERLLEFYNIIVEYL